MCLLLFGLAALQVQLKIGSPQFYTSSWPLVEEGYEAILIISYPTWKYSF